MVADVFCFSDDQLLGKTNEKTISFTVKQLFLLGYKISSITTYGSFGNVSKNELETTLHNETLRIIFLQNNSNLKSDLCSILCQITSSVTVVSDEVKRVIENLYKTKNQPLLDNVSVDFTFPKNAKIIVNSFSNTQGYILKYKSLTYVILPVEFESAKSMIENSLVEYLSNQLSVKYNAQTFKTFGITTREIKLVLNDIMKNKDKVSINIFSNLMENDIVIRAKSDNTNLSIYSQKIFDRLNKFIYAEEDIDIFEATFRLLKLNHISLSVAESITGGNIISNLIKFNPGASEFIKLGVVTYSNQAKMSILGVSEKTLQTHTSVSVETTYDMATGLLKTSEVDVALATTGYASTDGSQNQTPGLTYIAVGDKKAIHVYKNIFFGTREEIIESATKAACFYLIKKLRKNDFHFNKTIV